MTTTSSAPTMSPVAKIRALHDRLIKAEALVADNKVHPVYGMADHYFVEGTEARYLVNGKCLCADATNRPELKWCKHRLAAVIYAEQQAIADTRQVVKATKIEDQASKASAKSESPRDPDLEAKIAELYH